jgi:hypothetical protein
MNNLIRVFISSTFLDFSEERTLIQERVIPELDKFAREHGARYEAVDLRWGITDEAQNDHETLEICLEEIKRSQDISPKPNFIVLLGQRYGTQLPPPKIKASTFEVLLLGASGEDRQTLNELYERDENQLPEAIYVLKPKGMWDKKYSHDKLLQILRKLVDKSNLDESELSQFYMSVTHHEIKKGILEVDNAHEHVTIYERTIVDLDLIPNKYMYTDESFTENTSNENSMPKLRSEIKSSKKYFSLKEYSVEFSSQESKKNYLENLINQIISDQKNLILKQISSNTDFNMKTNTTEQNHNFAIDRCKIFTGREIELEKINSYINSIDSNPLILIGEGGTGKSAILAKSYLNATESSEINLIRFIGGVPETSKLEHLFNGIIDELNKKLNLDIGIVLKNREQYDTFFSELFLKIPKGLKVNLFIDSLDQIESSSYTKFFSWLPSNLPKNIKVIMSVRENIDLIMIKKTEKPFEYLNLGGLEHNYAIEALKQYLFLKNRKLTEVQVSTIMNSYLFEKNPLWLRIVSQLSVAIKSNDEISRLPTTIEGILLRFFNELSQPGKHGPKITSRVLSYIAASENGLSEDEIQTVLGLDKIVREEFSQRSKEIWEHNYLPPIIWSRLRKDLQPYLIENFTENTLVLNFFHREFKDFITKLYVNPIDDTDYVIKIGLFIIFNKPLTEYAWFSLLEGNRQDPKILRSAHNQWKYLFEIIRTYRAVSNAYNWFNYSAQGVYEHQEEVFTDLFESPIIHPRKNLSYEVSFRESHSSGMLATLSSKQVESIDLHCFEAYIDKNLPSKFISRFFLFEIKDFNLWNFQELRVLHEHLQVHISFLSSFEKFYSDFEFFKKFNILDSDIVLQYWKPSIQDRVLFYAYVHGFRGLPSGLNAWVKTQPESVEKFLKFIHKTYIENFDLNEMFSYARVLQIEGLEEVYYFILSKNLDQVLVNQSLRDSLFDKLVLGERAAFLTLIFSSKEVRQNLLPFEKTISDFMTSLMHSDEKVSDHLLIVLFMVSKSFSDGLLSESNLLDKYLNLVLKFKNAGAALRLTPYLEHFLKDLKIGGSESSYDYFYFDGPNWRDTFYNEEIYTVNEENYTALTDYEIDTVDKVRVIYRLAAEMESSLQIRLILEGKLIDEVKMLYTLAFTNEKYFDVASYFLLSRFDVEPAVLKMIYEKSIKNNSQILMVVALNSLFTSKKYSKLKETLLLRGIFQLNIQSFFSLGEYFEDKGDVELSQEIILWGLLLKLCNSSWEKDGDFSNLNLGFETMSNDLAKVVEPQYQILVNKIMHLPTFVSEIINIVEKNSINKPEKSNLHGKSSSDDFEILFLEEKFVELEQLCLTIKETHKDLFSTWYCRAKLGQDQIDEVLSLWSRDDFYDRNNPIAIGDLKRLLDIATQYQKKGNKYGYEKFLYLAAFTKPIICNLHWWSDNFFWGQGWIDMENDKGYRIGFEESFFKAQKNEINLLDKFACRASLFLIKILFDKLQNSHIEIDSKNEKVSELIKLFENIYSRARSIESLSLLGEVHYYHAKLCRFLGEENDYYRHLELSAQLNFIEAVDELIEVGAEANNLVSVNSWSLLRESL